MIDPDLLKEYGVDSVEIGKRLVEHFNVTEEVLSDATLNYFMYCPVACKVYGIRVAGGNRRYTRSWDYDYYLQHWKYHTPNGVISCFNDHLPPSLRKKKGKIS